MPMWFDSTTPTKFLQTVYNSRNNYNNGTSNDYQKHPDVDGECLPDESPEDIRPGES